MNLIFLFDSSSRSSSGGLYTGELGEYCGELGEYRGELGEA